VAGTDVKLKATLGAKIVDLINALEMVVGQWSPGLKKNPLGGVATYEGLKALVEKKGGKSAYKRKYDKAYKDLKEQYENSDRTIEFHVETEIYKIWQQQREERLGEGETDEDIGEYPPEHMEDEDWDAASHIVLDRMAKKEAGEADDDENPEIKIANNSYVRKEGDAYVIKLHDTDIIKVLPKDFYILNNGDYFTPLTKDRIEIWTPANISAAGKGKWKIGDTDYYNGILINKKGKPVPSATLARQALNSPEIALRYLDNPKANKKKVGEIALKYVDNDNIVNKAIKHLDSVKDKDLLLEIAKGASNYIIEKIISDYDDQALYELAIDTESGNTLPAAINKIEDADLLYKLASDKDYEWSVNAITRLAFNDENDLLYKVYKTYSGDTEDDNDARFFIAEKITDNDILYEIYKSGKVSDDSNIEILKKIEDAEILKKIHDDSDDKTFKAEILDEIYDVKILFKMLMENEYPEDLVEDALERNRRNINSNSMAAEIENLYYKLKKDGNKARLYLISKIKDPNTLVDILTSDDEPNDFKKKIRIPNHLFPDVYDKIKDEEIKLHLLEGTVLDTDLTEIALDPKESRKVRRKALLQIDTEGAVTRIVEELEEADEAGLLVLIGNRFRADGIKKKNAIKILDVLKEKDPNNDDVHGLAEIVSQELPRRFVPDWIETGDRPASYDEATQSDEDGEGEVPFEETAERVPAHKVQLLRLLLTYAKPA